MNPTLRQSPTIANKSRPKVAIRDLLMIGLFFSLVMDFRRAEGDTDNIVVILGLMNFAFGAALIFLERFHHRKTLIAILPFFVFAVSASAVGVTRGQAPLGVFAQALPLIIFTQTALVCASYPKTPTNLNKILTLAVISGVIAATWKLYFSFRYFDLDLATVRYQILSGASALLFGYALAGFLTGGRRYTWLALVMSVGVVFLAVTRTYIIMFAASSLVALLALPRSQSKKLFRRILVLALALTATLFLLSFTIPELANRWIQRLFSYQEVGVDVTALTRIAETRGQLQQMQEDFKGLLFGFGMTATTEWTGPEMDTLVTIMNWKRGDSTVGYGHNLYFGSIFIGGLIFGLPMVLTMIWLTFSPIPKIRRYWSQLSKDEQFTAIFALSASVSYLGYGLLGGTFGDRSGSFYYGIAMGLQLWIIRSLRLKALQRDQLNK